MRRWWLGMAVGLVVLAGGCGFFREEKPVVVAQQTQPSTFDPHLANETVVYSTLSNVVEGLVRFSPYLQLEPALAVRWQQESPTAVRFWLRQGVVFHNGQELTARDVVASVLRARDHPRSQLKHLVRDVVEVKAEEPLSVVIRTSTPAPTLLKRLVFVAVVPEAQAQEREILVPIGTGPYRIVKREGTTLEMRAVPWWGGMPQIKKARFLFEENDQHRTSLFLAKKVEVCAWLRKEDVAEAARQKDLRVVQQPRLSVQMLALSPRAASGEAARALADVRVRRALLLALNRQRLVEEVARGDAVVASQLVHPLVFGYDPSLPPVPYDPERRGRFYPKPVLPRVLPCGWALEEGPKTWFASFRRIGRRLGCGWSWSFCRFLRYWHGRGTVASRSFSLPAPAPPRTLRSFWIPRSTPTIPTAAGARKTTRAWPILRWTASWKRPPASWTRKSAGRSSSKPSAGFWNRATTCPW